MIKLPRFTQLRVNILSGPFTSALNVVVMAISYPLYLHFLGYEKVGVWLLLSSVQTFAQLGLLGIGPALTKLVAEERGRDNQISAQAYVSLSTIILSVTGSIAVAAICAFRGNIVHGMGLTGGNANSALMLLPWVGLLTAICFLNQLTSAALAGVGRIDLVNYNATLAKICVLILEAILLTERAGLVTLLIGDFAGAVGMQIAGSYQLRKFGSLHLLKHLAWDRERVGKLVTFGGSMLIASLAVLLVSPFNKWALSRYAGVALVPIYDIAFNGSMQLRGLVEVGLRAIMPAVSHQLSIGTARALGSVRRLYRRTTLFLLVILPPGYGMALLLAKPLLMLWLGNRFVPEIVGTFDIMLGAAVVSLLAVPAFFTLMASGHVRDCMVSHLLAACINLMIVAGAITLHGRVSLQLVSVSVLITMLGSTIYLLLRAQTILQDNPLATPSHRNWRPITRAA